MLMEILSAHDHREDAALLIREYTDSILEKAPMVAKVLSSQHIDDELADLDKKYALPKGRLYVAYIDGKPAASVGLAPKDEVYCEIKRLYIRPAFRGHHLSRILVEKIIEDARKSGYTYMRLDTFPFMKEALSLYKSCGFYEIGKYNDNPDPDAIFMEKKL